MKIFQTEMNCPAFSCRVNRYDGLCEDKVLPPGGVPLRYIEDSAVPQSTKQGAKYPSAGHRRVQPLLIKPGIYIYDALNRLTEVRNNSNNTLIEGYSYDPLGNRKTKTDGTNIVYYVYDAANQLTQITGNENATLLYDDNGNMYRKTQGTTVTDITYDALNRLTQVNKTGIDTQSYTYDHEGRRISKTVGASTTNFLYNGPDIVSEYTNWTTAAAQYTHGPNMDDPIIRTAGTTKQYYHQDGLGSVVAVSDQTGATTGTQRFDAWGNKQSSGSTGTVPQYGYTGREPDETGLVYYRARYYDPTIGRFTQRDPIGMNGGINPYAYVNANPVNFTDPMGLKLREIGQMNYDTQITNYFNTSNDTTQGQGLSAGSQGLSQVAASNETTDEAQKVVAQGGWPWAAISLASTSDSPASINRLNAIFWLAKIIYAESRSDWRVPGALEATAWTVRNRVETEGFPWTYYEVITAPDQFSSVTSTKNTGWGDFVNTNLSKEKAAVRDRCFEVAKGVYDGSTADPTKAVTGGALFFHAVDPSYQPLPGEIRFGGQVYYRNYKKW